MVLEDLNPLIWFRTAGEKKPTFCRTTDFVYGFYVDTLDVGI